MIYLFINEGKDDAAMIPMSAVDSISLTIGEDLIKATRFMTKAGGEIVVGKTDTVNVVTTEDFEQYVAQKLYGVFGLKYN